MTSTFQRSLHRTAHSTLFAGALLATACGNATLDLADEPPARPAVEAQGCDEHPELPSPVKVLLLVDISGSLQFTDAPGVRFTALRTFVDRLAAQGAQVSTMGFGASVFVAPAVTGPSDALFIPASEWEEPEFLTLADVQTDLQGALSVARMHLQADIARTEPDELARTRYVTVLFTDGAPSPVCCVEGAERVDEPADEYGCAAESWEEPTAGTYCGATHEPTLCDDPEFLLRARENATGAPGGPNYGEGAVDPYAGLVAGDNYNRRGSLEDAARLIGALTQDGVGAVDVHAFMLVDPTLPDEVKQIYNLNACRTQRTLEAVAESVAGTTGLLGSSLAIDFTSVDTTPLCD